MSPRRRRAGVSLLEILIASAMLAAIALALLMVTVPLTRLTSDTTVALEMDARARSFFGYLRPRLRQSGFGSSTVEDPTGGGTFCFPLVTSTGTSKVKGAMYLLEDTAIDADTDFDKLTFRCRTSPAAGAVSGDGDWSARNVIFLETTGGRLSISHTQVDGTGGTVRPKLILESGDVSALRFVDGDNTLPNGDGTIEVTLTLVRGNPNFGQAGEAREITRAYVDRVILMNRQ